MKLLIIRHGRAEERDDWAKTGANDDARPLTDDGRERMRIGTIGLHSLVETIDVLTSSPLVRTQQTARIVADAYGIDGIVEIEALRSDAAPTELYEWLRGMEGKDVVAIVGHNNHLEKFAGWLLTGSEDGFLKIKKGGVVMLETKGMAREHGRPERTKLLWALTPAQLRRLAG